MCARNTPKERKSHFAPQASFPIVVLAKCFKGRDVLQTIAIDLPRIITSIDQPFHHTNLNTMSPTRRLLRSRSASGLGGASGWPGTPPRLRRPKRPLSATGHNRFDDRTHPNTPKSPYLFKKYRFRRRLHRRAACSIEPIDLYASDGATSQYALPLSYPPVILTSLYHHRYVRQTFRSR